METKSTEQPAVTKVVLSTTPLHLRVLLSSPETWCWPAHAHLRFCTCSWFSEDICWFACTVTSMQVLHRCFPFAFVLQDLGSNHLPNIVFASFWLQPMQNHKSLVFLVQSLQSRSRGCFHAYFENSSSDFVFLHRRQSNCSG